MRADITRGELMELAANLNNANRICKRSFGHGIQRTIDVPSGMMLAHVSTQLGAPVHKACNADGSYLHVIYAGIEFRTRPLDRQ